MADNLEMIEVAGQEATSGEAIGMGFLVVAIDANTTHRYVEARISINGGYVGRLTASDNAVPGVHSCSGQVTTIPVPAGASWRVQWNVPNNNGEVRAWFLRG